MRFLLTATACAALGVCAADAAMGQGPVRQGLRRTGEIAAEGTRRVAEGAGQVARGVGEAAVGTARATGRAIGEATGLTPDQPIQARADANLAASDQGREARWRFARHNGEWWYYTPQNTWVYHRGGRWNEFAEDSFTPPNQGQFDQNQQFAQGQPLNQGQPYSSGYRGLDQSDQFARQPGHQVVRVDRFGREFICENGRPVYLDQGQGQQYRSGYRGPAQPDERGAAPTPAGPESQSIQRQNVEDQAAPPQPQQTAPAPATPAPQGEQGDADVSTAPAGGTSDSQATGDPAAPREINNNPTPATQGAVEN